MFVDEARSAARAPTPPAAAPDVLSRAAAEATEARLMAERAAVVSESTAAAARTARDSAREALRLAEQAESQAAEAASVAREMTEQARSARARLEQLRRERDAEKRPAPVPANRISPWIEYPQENKSAGEPARPLPARQTRAQPGPRPAGAEEVLQPAPRGKAPVPKGYQIIRRIGEDGFGTLYLARQISMDRLVQLRLVGGGGAGDGEATERFLREARTAGSFDHPNVMRVFAAGCIGSQCYCVNENLEGRTLATAVAEAGRFAPRRACETVRALASGLQQWEGHGLVHGGLNPARVFEGSSGEFKLMGLGLPSRGMDLMTGLPPAELSYVAPELILGDRFDSRADVYSLGALLYFTLTGRAPHAADNRGDVVRAAREGPGILVGAMRGAPRPLVEAVRKAMQAEAADRYGRIPELIAALDTAIEGSRSIAAMTERARSSRRRRR
jgi:hypothetical protein